MSRFRKLSVLSVVVALALAASSCNLPTVNARARCSPVGSYGQAGGFVVKCNAKRRWEKGLSVDKADQLLALFVAAFKPASVTATGGGQQVAVRNAAFANPLTVKVLSGASQPVKGATVSFSAPGSGPSVRLSAASAVTGADGVASITATALSAVGDLTVTATVAGVTTPASFPLTVRNSVGYVTTYAGTGGLGSTDAIHAVDATFGTPHGLALGPDGSLFVADSAQNNIRKVAPNGGAVSLVAGSGAGTSGVAVTGPVAGTAARFNTPTGIAVDSSGVAFVADSGNSAIRRIAVDNTVSKVDLTGGVALSQPHAVAVATDGTLYIADAGSNKILKVAPGSNAATVLAGSGSAVDSDGTGSGAGFHSPRDLLLVDGILFVADLDGWRRVTPAGVVTTISQTPGGTGQESHLGGNSSSRLMMTDAYSHVVVAFLPDIDWWSLAGNGAAGSSDGSGAAARFRNPEAVVVAPDGTIYVADAGNHTIRRIQEI